jgi:hypothetical protein
MFCRAAEKSLDTECDHGAKARIDFRDLRGAEAPLFLGATRFLSSQ